MKYYIRAAGVHHHRSKGCPTDGEYLMEYQPEAVGGLGGARWTPRIEDALAFESAGAALACYRQVPKNRPRRPDGTPNRPLTAFTIEIGTLEDFLTTLKRGTELHLHHCAVQSPACQGLVPCRDPGCDPERPGVCSPCRGRT